MLSLCGPYGILLPLFALEFLKANTNRTNFSQITQDVHTVTGFLGSIRLIRAPYIVKTYLKPCMMLMYLCDVLAGNFASSSA